MRKTYEKEFKLEICKKIREGKKTVTEISKEYEISRPIVSRWMAEYKKYGNRAFKGKGKRLPDKAEIYALKSKIEILEKENEILKKFKQFVKSQKS
jgi:transposase